MSGLLWLAVIVILASFTGTLTSYLTVSVISLPYSTLEQVIQSSDYRIRLDTESVFAEILQVRNEVCVDRGGWHYNCMTKLRIALQSN